MVDQSTDELKAGFHHLIPDWQLPGIIRIRSPEQSCWLEQRSVKLAALVASRSNPVLCNDCLHETRPQWQQRKYIKCVLCQYKFKVDTSDFVAKACCSRIDFPNNTKQRPISLYTGYRSILAINTFYFPRLLVPADTILKKTDRLCDACVLDWVQDGTLLPRNVDDTHPAIDQVECAQRIREYLSCLRPQLLRKLPRDFLLADLRVIIASYVF